MLIETILGGVTGLIGNVVGGWFKLKERKLDLDIHAMNNTHELSMLKAETQAMIMEAKANIKITQAQVEGAVDIKDADAFMQSQTEGNKNLFSNKWIDALQDMRAINQDDITLNSMIDALNSTLIYSGKSKSDKQQTVFYNSKKENIFELLNVIEKI